MMWAPIWAAIWAGVGGDVEGGLALLAQVGAAGVGPDDDDEAVAFGLLSQGLELLVHLHARGRAGVDGVADGGAPEAQGGLHRAGHGLQGVGVGSQVLAVVELEDQGRSPA